jgi:hypothetical protein
MGSRSLRTSAFRAIAIVALALAGGSFVQKAHGADAKVEADATKADSDAMDLWLAADFKGAKAKLDGALKKCGKDKCGDSVLAALHRDLGVVLITMGKKGDGAKEFDAAFAADSAVTLAKDYQDNPDVKSAWETAKKNGGGSTTATTPTSTGTTTAPTTNPDAEGGLSLDFKEGPKGVVFPIIVAVPDGLDVESVKVSYKSAAMDKYKTMDAKKDDSGKFIATLPCDDTQFQGDIKIYIRAYDPEKNEVDHLGTYKKPAVIHIADKLDEGTEPPSFPGGKEPDKCVEKGDCQPGFPCDKGGNKKPAGSGCESDDECDAGLACIENSQGKKLCNEAEGGGGGGGGGGASKGKKLWIGADVSADLLYIGQASDICNDNAWACTKSGADVGVRPDQGVEVAAGGGGKTSGGPALGTIRAYLSLDYFVGTNIALGLRAGYAFNGNNSSNATFTPIHAEGRLTYFLGKSPTTDPKGFKPYVMAGGGFAEFDAAVPDIVAIVSRNSVLASDDAQAGGTACQTAYGSGTADDVNANCRITGIKAYRLAGKTFAEIGTGFWYMLSPKMALNVGLKILLPFPTFSPGIAPEVGIKF